MCVCAATATAAANTNNIHICEHTQRQTRDPTNPQPHQPQNPTTTHPATHGPPPNPQTQQMQASRSRSLTWRRCATSGSTSRPTSSVCCCGWVPASWWLPAGRWGERAGGRGGKGGEDSVCVWHAYRPRVVGGAGRCQLRGGHQLAGVGAGGEGEGRGGDVSVSLC